MLVYGSVCSGIEAASVAWGPLGWECAFVSEIEPFPSAVLAHHYPGVPNFGDFTTIRRSPRPIDVLVGGTPCQSFSVAGLRGGMDDSRGVLALEFLRLADRLRPEWVVWENVPGVLSSNGGRDFGAFLGGLAELGYGWAYRVLDAQHFGVPQRRRRVFVVGRAGDWRGAAAVLFERHSLSGDPSPSRTTGEEPSGSVARSLRARSNLAHREDADTLIARTLTAHPSGRFDGDTETFVTHTLRGEGFDASEDGTGRGTPLVPVPIPIDLRQASRGEKDTNFRSHGSGGPPGVGCGHPGDPAFTVSERGQAIAFNPQAGGKQTSLGYDPNSQTAGTLSVCQTPAVAYQCQGSNVGPMGTLRSGNGNETGGVPFISGPAVRRLTPLECERLQGFPDGWTLIPVKPVPAKGQAKAQALLEAGDKRFMDIGGVVHFTSADGPRYKALGNSMAVPVMAWIGQRIAEFA